MSVAVLVGAVAFALYDLEVSFGERADFEEFVHAAGLQPERHFVETEDGFVLALHRVLPHFNCTDPGALDRVPVLLQHGLMEDSSIWMMFGNRSLAFTLAMQGFDVWMGNSRGTVESQAHMRHTRDQVDYWEFSFEEMGRYDFAANVEYVLATTGARRLIYIGQSQGGGQALVGLSLRASLQSRVQLLVLLAPGAFISPPSHPFIGFIYEWCASGSFGDMEFVPYFYEFRTWLPKYVLSYFGEAVMRWMGFVRQPIEESLLSTLYIQTPSGSTSIRNLQVRKHVSVVNLQQVYSFSLSLLVSGSQ
jgi:pimeloyl-ACP methyl ester carboxylesterase